MGLRRELLPSLQALLEGSSGEHRGLQPLIAKWIATDELLSLQARLEGSSVSLAQLALEMLSAMAIPLHKYAALLLSTAPALESRFAPPLDGAHDDDDAADDLDIVVAGRGPSVADSPALGSDEIAELCRSESGPRPVSGVRLDCA